MTDLQARTDDGNSAAATLFRCIVDDLELASDLLGDRMHDHLSRGALVLIKRAGKLAAIASAACGTAAEVDLDETVVLSTEALLSLSRLRDAGRH